MQVAAPFLPPIAREKLDGGLAALKDKAHNDLRIFCAVYLGHHFTFSESENEHPEWNVQPGWGQPQQDLANTFTNFVLRKPGYERCTNVVIECFRGAGKSTIGLTGGVTWLAATCRRRFIVIISDTKTQAVDQLASVLSELEENDYLKQRYGELYVDKRTRSKTERKRQDDVTLTNGVRIVARGAGQKLRGSKWGKQRPDCVIMDDPQGEDQAESAEQMEKRCRWIERVVLPMGTLNTLFILIATPLRHGDVIDRMTGKAATKHVRYPALDDAGEPTDPFRFTKERLEYLLEQMGPTSFDQEMRLVPAGEEQKPFQAAWFGGWPTMTRPEDGAAVVGWDPKAKEKEEGDYFSACQGRLLMQRRQPARVVVERCVRGRIGMKQQAELVVMLAIKSKARVIVVETIAAQDWARAELERVLKEYNYTCRIIGQEHHNDKRIFLEKTLQVPLFTQEIVFVANKETEGLKEELVQFPFGSFDDRCDALADMYLGTVALRKGLALGERMQQLTRYIKEYT